MSNNKSISKVDRQQRAALMEQLQFLGQMSSTETALFHQAAASAYGLGITDMKTISTLMQEGAMTAGQLSVRLSLTTGAVTNVIDRLEHRGLVSRKADDNDRRKVIVSANPQKIAHAENPYTSIGETFMKLFETFTTEQLEFLVQYSQTTIELTQQEIAKLARTKPEKL